jgi:hypothetical protein
MMQTPGSRIPPRRAAAITGDLYTTRACLHQALSGWAKPYQADQRHPTRQIYLFLESRQSKKFLAYLGIKNCVAWNQIDLNK